MNYSQKIHNPQTIDLVLIGSGIMSATLATFIKILQPNWKIHIYERLTKVAQESSNAWNNAGTGHAAFCELNYTPQNTDGSIDISKAIKISESFEISRQFWSYLTKKKFLNNPKTFINNIPHMSFVWGENNIKLLRKRFNILKNNTLFYGMQYSENPRTITQWAPLIMEGRDPDQKIAATYMEIGTDINYGEITQQLIHILKNQHNIQLHLNHNVTNIKKNTHNNTWSIYIINNNNKQKIKINTKYIFIGAGGKTLSLLQTTGIQEIKGYAGFPVGGQFLVTNNQTIIKKHLAKVYGQTLINTPPMSIPHIDTRIINGLKFLLFGPFATFSGKFLKHGSQFDFLDSLTFHNLLPIFEVGIKNFQLIKYLINQLMMSHKEKFHILQKYYPNAKFEDWTLFEAGQRVQIIKKNKKNQGILQFGTEIINTDNGTLSALLGASPGASTTALIILKILHIMFKKEITKESWIKKIKEIIPSYNYSLNDDITLTNNIRKYICDTLKLKHVVIKNTNIE